MLPLLATAAQIAEPLGITSRTITAWAAAGTIPIAFRRGKILRFHPPAVAAALGVQYLSTGDGDSQSVSLNLTQSTQLKTTPPGDPFHE